LSFPQPPAPPELLVWANYVRDFEAYLAEWPVFNKNIVHHFYKRQQMFEELKKEGYSCCSAGVQKYLDWLEEDKQVRQKWMVACDAHQLHVQEFWRRINTPPNM
jgi:hypothetical protein